MHLHVSGFWIFTQLREHARCCI